MSYSLAFVERYTNVTLCREVIRRDCNVSFHAVVVMALQFNITLIFLFFDKRYLTEKVVPGNRVTVMGIYSIKKVAQKADKVYTNQRCINQ